MTDSDVSKQTGLSLRKGIYYVRVVVPLDLRAVYEGRETIARSLGTRDLREAKLRATVNLDPKDRSASYAILDDRPRPYYEHRLAA